ncbi:choline BCCT transporter BetT [Naumannella halotolerans]|uniref:Choline/glycine/proline betaine transport protein n=1 Tax=Naumannella halotolerans TaxID=993414 RepID=A0A4R7J245_9ACTN|nr:choline BCCT transporter BetT [Naumannella halotolerans]TDT31210.1 choline/glycine/proline betaine transport protein [Naumannella halotolerans]
MSAPATINPPAGGTAPGVEINWPVLIVSAAIILLIAILAIIAPETTQTVIYAIVDWVSTNFGWYYVLTATVIVGFVLYMALSRFGRVRLGPDHSRPVFNLFTWTAMLFAAGIGIDLMFFSVAEPVTQYIQPPTAYDSTGAQPESIAAARQAVVWTLFHYGITGWAMYALLGVGFAYFAYRKGWPLSLRSMLRPIFGRRMDGWVGHSVDIAAVLGAVFGIATSLGIGVVQLNYGLYLMFGIPEGTAAQIALIVLSVVMATISSVSGVEKGIRRLSELNVIMAIILLLYVLFMDKTQFLMNALVMNIGDFVSRYPAMMMETFAFEQAEFAGLPLPFDTGFMTGWMGGWTLFFWAWWIAWAPFVGLFLARISRGRTIRQFVTGVLVVPFMFILIFISIFGNASLGLVAGGDAAFGEVAMNTPERAFYSLLEAYPAAPLVIGIATLVGLLFYVTSADSGALVLANFTSDIPDAKSDGDTRLRIFWSVATGLLTLGMLIVGGVSTLQGATLIIGLPFSVVMYLVMFSLYRALRREVQHADGYRQALSGTIGAVAGREFSWRQRLRRATGFPSRNQVSKYMTETAVPSLKEVAAEFRASGAEVSVDVSEVPDAGVMQAELHVEMPEAEPFNYQIWPVSGPTPSFAFRVASEADRYYRLEVFTANGSRGYDVYGYTAEQLIADVIAHYESHLEYLRLAQRSPVDADEHKTMDWKDDFSSTE